MWYANERVAAKPYGDGDITVICATNRVENEQDWKSVQFISTAAVLINCKIIYVIHRRNEFHVSFSLSLGLGLGLGLEPHG